MTEAYDESLKLHEKHRGKLSVNVKVPLNNKKDLALAQTISTSKDGVIQDFKDRANDTSKLLEEKEVNSVKAAAYSTGFPNVVYFSRQFKATFGYLPSELL